jgi:hypothetical protein
VSATLQRDHRLTVCSNAFGLSRNGATPTRKPRGGVAEIRSRKLETLIDPCVTILRPGAPRGVDRLNPRVLADLARDDADAGVREPTQALVDTAIGERARQAATRGVGGLTDAKALSEIASAARSSP